MVEIHKAASRHPFNSIAGDPLLPLPSSGVLPVRYQTNPDSLGVQVVLGGYGSRYVEGVVGAIVAMWDGQPYDPHGETWYMYRRMIYDDSDYESVEQLEDEMIELFNNVVEALERGKNIKSVADYYGLEEY